MISIISITKNDLGILDTISSVFSQSSNAWELIIVDASNDSKFTSPLHELIHGHARLTYINEPDKGISDAFNKGLKKCHGDWVIFLNGGDTFFSSTVIEECLNLLNDHSDDDVVCGSVRSIGKCGKPNIITASQPSNLTRRNYMWNPICHQATFFSKRIYMAYPYDIRLSMAMDLDLLLRMNNDGCKFSTINCMISNYRLGGFTSSDRYYVRNHIEHALINMLNKRNVSAITHCILFARNYSLIIARRFVGLFSNFTHR